MDMFWICNESAAKFVAHLARIVMRGSGCAGVLAFPSGGGFSVVSLREREGTKHGTTDTGRQTNQR